MKLKHFTGALPDLRLVVALPKARVIEIYGPESSGTTVALHALRSSAKVAVVVLLMLNTHFDPTYAAAELTLPIC